MMGLLGLVSCKKPENRSCFKRSGDFSERTISLGNFNRLDLRERMEFVLIQDSTNKVVIEGGKNLLNLVEVTENEGLVTIVNQNRCNFLRKFAIPTVVIHFTRLINLKFEGTERLYNLDTLITDYLTLTFKDGGGTIDIKVKASDIKAENTNGWGNLVLHGSTQSLRAILMGDGAFDFQGLMVSNALKILTVSSRDQKIGADGIPLQVQIDGVGNVRYWGIPSSIFLNSYGSGKLINSN
jgi:hypothetical protein